MSWSDKEQTWLDKALHGDVQALTMLLAAQYPALRSRAEAGIEQALRAKLDPEDILQEVFLDVFRNLEHYKDRGPSSFLSWMKTILDSKLINARRALHRQKRDLAREVSTGNLGGTRSYLNLLDEVYAASATPSGVVRRDEAIGALLACISSLTEPHRQVIQWRYLEGRPVAEVANRLNRSEASVIALTQAALKALRESMDGLGEFTRG